MKTYSYQFGGSLGKILSIEGINVGSGFLHKQSRGLTAC